MSEIKCNCGYAQACREIMEYTGIPSDRGYEHYGDPFIAGCQAMLTECRSFIDRHTEKEEPQLAKAIYEKIRTSDCLIVSSLVKLKDKLVPDIQSLLSQRVEPEPEDKQERPQPFTTIDSENIDGNTTIFDNVEPLIEVFGTKKQAPEPELAKAISPLPWKFVNRGNGYIEIQDANSEPVIPDWDINEDASVGMFCDAYREISNFKYIVEAANNYRFQRVDVEGLLNAIRSGKFEMWSIDEDWCKLSLEEKKKYNGDDGKMYSNFVNQRPIELINNYITGE